MAVHTSEVLIVGSGGNAISMAAKLIEAGVDDLLIITKHGDFGGAWYQNKYPGCGTDAAIALYQLGFALSYEWEGTHADSDDVERYLQGVARQHGLYERTHFDTELLSARWLEDEARWEVTTNGDTFIARVLIPVTGFLEEPVIPRIPGQEDFRGRIFHASQWPEGYTGEGDRIAVVGTGSSGIQVVPAMQRVAEHVYCFQRTPNWIVPKEERLLTAEEREQIRTDPSIIAAQREDLIAWGEGFWHSVILGKDLAMLAQVQGMAEQFLEQQVPDPELRALLTPTHPIGCKRPGSSDDFYWSLQQPNVTLVPEAVASIGEHTVRSAGGREVEVDTVVWATGYFFGGHILHRIHRRDGVTVGEHQQGRPRAYKAVSVAGCPNVFLVGGAGPNGQVWDGLAVGEVVCHYVLLALDYMREEGLEAIEVDEAAEIEWKRETDATLATAPNISGACTNYSQDEFGGNKASWPGTLEHMNEQMTHFDPAVYRPVRARESAEV